MALCLKQSLKMTVKENLVRVEMKSAQLLLDVASFKEN